MADANELMFGKDAGKNFWAIKDPKVQIQKYKEVVPAAKDFSDADLTTYFGHKREQAQQRGITFDAPAPPEVRAVAGPVAGPLATGGGHKVWNGSAFVDVQSPPATTAPAGPARGTPPPTAAPVPDNPVSTFDTPIPSKRQAELPPHKSAVTAKGNGIPVAASGARPAPPETRSWIDRPLSDSLSPGGVASAGKSLFDAAYNESASFYGGIGNAVAAATNGLTKRVSKAARDGFADLTENKIPRATEYLGSERGQAQIVDTAKAAAKRGYEALQFMETPKGIALTTGLVLAPELGIVGTGAAAVVGSYMAVSAVTGAVKSIIEAANNPSPKSVGIAIADAATLAPIAHGIKTVTGEGIWELAKGKLKGKTGPEVDKLRAAITDAEAKTPPPATTPGWRERLASAKDKLFPPKTAKEAAAAPDAVSPEVAKPVEPIEVAKEKARGKKKAAQAKVEPVVSPAPVAAVEPTAVAATPAPAPVAVEPEPQPAAAVVEPTPSVTPAPAVEAAAEPAKEPAPVAAAPEPAVEEKPLHEPTHYTLQKMVAEAKRAGIASITVSSKALNGEDVEIKTDAWPEEIEERARELGQAARLYGKPTDTSNKTLWNMMVEGKPEYVKQAEGMPKEGAVALTEHVYKGLPVGTKVTYHGELPTAMGMHHVMAVTPTGETKMLQFKMPEVLEIYGDKSAAEVAKEKTPAAKADALSDLKNRTDRQEAVKEPKKPKAKLTVEEKDKLAQQKEIERLRAANTALTAKVGPVGKVAAPAAVASMAKPSPIKPPIAGKEAKAAEPALTPQAIKAARIKELNSLSSDAGNADFSPMELEIQKLTVQELEDLAKEEGLSDDLSDAIQNELFRRE